MPTAAEPLTRSIRVALPRAVEIRHDLHRHPELGHQESRTAALVQRELAALGIDHVGGLAKGTGVLGYLPAKFRLRFLEPIRFDAEGLHEDKALVQTTAHEVRARIQESLWDMLATRKSVWFG